MLIPDAALRDNGVRTAIRDNGAITVIRDSGARIILRRDNGEHGRRTWKTRHATRRRMEGKTATDRGDDDDDEDDGDKDVDTNYYCYVDYSYDDELG